MVLLIGIFHFYPWMRGELLVFLWKKRRCASQQPIKSTSELLSGSDKLSRGLRIDKTISFYYRELGSIKDSEILAKVIFLLNGPLSHTLLISYHISSLSHLHKKRTFPCASLLIFYFFFLSLLHIFRGYPFSVTSCVSSAFWDS